jgi:hypothetical protein
VEPLDAEARANVDEARQFKQLRTLRDSARVGALALLTAISRGLADGG